ncbi:Trk K+ transport system, NAD-binding component [Lentimicrobium saccharophilum]|uniref:Trk system potassium uptake protein TrkA n=1 Tax=Lentimicrobium saccharophilum TaxID=1678841 RepID=A0A0S7C4N3_9BACT|nr:Trk system potassium transporter TrkA [Lentimicrobium saccharophilum]GAP43907.1 Trk K+ transport system, NAD-binding component [Lentimicrobium saccharophilum]
MNIIIAGDGEVGFHLAKMLSGENHNITIVDPHQELLKMIETHTDLMTITGDSTSISVLEQANVRRADLLISVVHDEKINITTCVLGKKLGARRTIARINNTEYLTIENREIMRSLGIDAMVCPERIAAKEIVKLLGQTAATEIFDFSEGRLSLFLIKLDEKALVLNKTLNQVAHENPRLDFRAIAIHRNNKTIIPKGDDVFKLNDLAYVITKPDGVDSLLRLGGKQKQEIRNVMIVGGGRIGRKTARRIERDMNVKLIEIDKERCLNLIDQLEHTLIINADARDIDLLEDEGIRNMDAFIAVTNDYETNILTCLLAQRFGVKRVIPLVENIDYIGISQSIGIETIINKKLITASYIVRFTMDAEVTSIKCLSGIDAEVLEFVVKPGAYVTRRPIKKIDIPKGCIIGGIVRGMQSFIAVGDFQIQEGDKVVIFALPEAISKVQALFN